MQKGNQLFVSLNFSGCASSPLLPVFRTLPASEVHLHRQFHLSVTHLVSDVTRPSIIYESPWPVFVDFALPWLPSAFLQRSNWGLARLYKILKSEWKKSQWWLLKLFSLARSASLFLLPAMFSKPLSEGTFLFHFVTAPQHQLAGTIQVFSLFIILPSKWACCLYSFPLAAIVRFPIPLIHTCPGRVEWLCLCISTATLCFFSCLVIWNAWKELPHRLGLNSLFAHLLLFVFLSARPQNRGLGRAGWALYRWDPVYISHAVSAVFYFSFLSFSCFGATASKTGLKINHSPYRVVSDSCTDFEYCLKQKRLS